MCKRTGVIPAVQILLFLLLSSVSPVLAQMSPGPLSKAHQDLEGPLNCAKCHAFGVGKAEFKCLDCHQEISRRMAAHRGYHGLQVKAGTKSNDCARCHSEHNGLEHPIVRWPSSREKFDHTQAGFRLEGKHADLKCDECHNSKYLDPLDRVVLKRKNPGASYTGLTATCTSCHKDVHAGEFPGSCLDCHLQSTWKKIPNFSHSKTKFVLTGKHNQIECSACHKPKDQAAGSVIQFKDFVAFQSCTGCHKDPHNNGFGSSCERCHTTTNWKQMVSSGTQFDHSKTRFPLLGKHIDVKCDACHKNDAIQGLPQFALCINCHRDPHLGQFSEQLAGSDCKVCHDENSFTKSTFSVAQHAQTAYPLVGKHATTDCEACHTKKDEHSQFKIAFAACTDCHKDAHTGQFANAPYFNKCDSCHDLNGYSPSTFGAIEHGKTRFALSGAHAAVPCSACHEPNKEHTKYEIEGGHCIDCHKSPHGDLAASLTCEGCHKTISWEQTTWFDHTGTKFPLTGRHTAVQCLGCHKPEMQAGKKVVPFTTSRQCESCHEDIHQGQFKSTNADQVICAECHTANDWRPTQFDHNRHSDFKLDGAHADVPCRLCHDRHQVAGKLVITYKGTPRECSKCHN